MWLLPSRSQKFSRTGRNARAQNCELRMPAGLKQSEHTELIRVQLMKRRRESIKGKSSRSEACAKEISLILCNVVLLNILSLFYGIFTFVLVTDNFIAIKYTYTHTHTHTLETIEGQPDSL